MDKEIKIEHAMFVSRDSVAKTKLVEPTAFISITDPALPEAILPDGAEFILRLKVHDIVPGSKHAVVFDGTPLDKLTPFDDVMANQILDFLEEVEDKVSLIVVNCEGGVSRSAGVAKFIAEKYDIEKRHLYDNYPHHNQHIFKTLWRQEIKRAAGL